MLFSLFQKWKSIFFLEKLMELIRIPQVSLVDATGRNIGVYTEDPDWWQQLKQKNEKSTNTSTVGVEVDGYVSMPDIPAVRRMMSIQDVLDVDGVGSGSSMHLRSRLSTAVVGRNSVIRAALANSEEQHENQCNVIGETPLHVAIIYDDLHTIKLLIETQDFDVNQRSIGGSFASGFSSKITSTMVQQSKYESLAYFGEYPLAFAACFASKEIYDYLVEKGADPNLQGTYAESISMRVNSCWLLFYLFI
jgi:hypothetical protein